MLPSFYAPGSVFGQKPVRLQFGAQVGFGRGNLDWLVRRFPPEPAI